MWGEKKLVMMTKGRESEGSGWMKDERNSVQKSTRESKVCRLRAEQRFLLQSVLRPFLLFVLLLLRADGAEEAIGVEIKIGASTLIAPWESLPRQAPLPVGRRYNMKHKRRMEEDRGEKKERLRGVRTREE